MTEQFHSSILDEHKRQLIEHGRRIGIQEQLSADISVAVWGNKDRGIPGLEQRVQNNERAVRVVQFYGPIAVALLAIIAAGQWPALMDLMKLVF